MKQPIQIGNITLVPLPENAVSEVINFDAEKSWVRWYLPDFSDNGNIDLPPGKYDLIGTWPGMTEDQICRVKMPYENEGIKCWPNLMQPCSEEDLYFPTDDPQEYFSSLLEARVYLKNPHADILTGKKPERRVPFKHAGFYTDNDKDELKSYNEQIKNWQSCEERTSPLWAVLINN